MKRKFFCEHYNIGIYYSEASPFDIEKLRQVVKKYEVTKTNVTDFYGWGKWVNGGAWITTKQGPIDLIYRNTEQVLKTIKNLKEGLWENDFEQQPPYGFSSLIYMAETDLCITLYDPQGIIKSIKKEVQQYPVKLKENIVAQSLWSAEFTIWQSQKFVKYNDIYNISGCLTRAVKNIVNALSAINECYLLGDKRAIQKLTEAKSCPKNFKEKIESILFLNKENLNTNINNLIELHKEVVELSGSYKPFFQLKE